MNDFEVNGHCADAFLPLKAAFLRNFADGLEVGASLAATWRGEPVVDLWAGYADREGTQPWAKDTLACVFSSTKVPTTICALMAVDRGLLELDEPVATYWPEFAAHGKEHVTVRDALTHRALVPGFDPPRPYTIMDDWDTMVSEIANQKPWFERGSLCYHGGTYGHLMGELVHRATGTPFQEFFLRELAEPLGADFHIGFRNRADFERLAKLTYPPPFTPEPGSIRERLSKGLLDQPEGVDLQANWDHMSVPRPGTNGCCNARSFARICTVPAMGGTVDGRHYLSREVVEEAATEQVHAECPLFGDIHMGLGFGLDGDLFPAPFPTSFHWGGWGGSWCLMDAERQLSVAYVMNKCLGGPDAEDARQERIWRALVDVGDQLG